MAAFASLIKEWFLGVNPVQLEAAGSRPDGKMMMYNRLSDFVLGVMATIISLDVLSVKLGVAVSSILAVGGLSSLVVALACKEPLTQIVYGLLVIFNDKVKRDREIENLV
jgi:small-conductance mechanosensitive channel